MEHREADMWQMADYGAPGDDTAQFLRELRQLRDAAGLGHAELAARAHFPYDSIRAAGTEAASPSHESRSICTNAVPATAATPKNAKTDTSPSPR